MKYGKKLVLFSLFALNLVDQPAPVVEIEQGKLSGIINSDGTVLQYIGIPYATANITNRFQAPLPPPKWDGVYRATEEYLCPQHVGRFGVIGTEDCLKINVYVPSKLEGPFPVMVFIHGGAFILGSGGKLIYGPEFLVEKDVILVTFNYRLGVLGFLCLGIKEAPGNAGLKDQIAALRWVKKNIAAFGGDPDNVTLFGESAGGVSTSALIVSEATTGLFKRAIVQSGSILSNWAINRKPVWVASLLAKELGYDSEDPKDLYEIISKVSYKDLISLKPRKPSDLFFDTELLHLPCVEKPIDSVEAVFTELPYNHLKKNFKNIPIIYGSNSKEGLLLIPEETVETVESKNNKYLFASDLEFSSDAEAAQVDKKLKEFYFENEHITWKSIMNISDLYTHLYFEIPIIFEAEVQLRKSKAPVYNYLFNYSGNRNFLKSRLGFENETGACHGDELLYLFKGIINPYRVRGKDIQMVEWLTTLWTNFAKYGEPTPTGTNVPVKWEPSTEQELKFLHIADDLQMGAIPNPDAYRVWKDVYEKYRRKHV